jgi:threonine dehydratase
MNVILPHVGLFADGTAVAQIGEKPFEVIQLQKSDNSGPIVEREVVLVNTDEICAAIKDTLMNVVASLNLQAQWLCWY